MPGITLSEKSNMSIKGITPALRAFLILTLIGIATVLIYYPGLQGPFVFDDTTNIVYNARVAISDLSSQGLLQAAYSNESGILKRPLATLSFALNHYFSGGYQNTFPYKVTNLAIHLFNAGFVYWLVLLLLKRNHSRLATPLDEWLPALITAAWALHPLNLTTVLYTVQRMNSLAALFVLAGLIIYVYSRQRIEQQRLYGFIIMGVGLVTTLTFGLLNKENAALLPLFMLIIEFTFYDRSKLNDSQRTKLKWFYTLTVLAPLTLICFWLLIRPELILSAYVGRDFSITQRLLTEPRILWFYVSLIAIPDIARLSLFHDDIAISTGIFSPWTTSLSLIGLIAVFALAILTKRKYPIFSFSVLWFLVGHSMESSFIGLEIAHEHRNYLPMIGLLTGGMYGLLTLLKRAVRTMLPIIAGFALVTCFGVVTYVRADTWASESGIIGSMAKYHPKSARAQAMLAEWYLHNNHPLQALQLYNVAATLSPNDASYWIKMAMVVTGITLEKSNDPGPSQEVEADNDNTPFKNPKETSGVGTVPEDILAHKYDNESRMALEKRISATIENLLEHKALNPSTKRTLGLLSSCISQYPNHCQALYPEAVKWYRAALRNRDVTGTARINTIIYFFNIAMWHGDYKLALEATENGKISDPFNSTYSLMEADVRISLNQLDDAERIVLSVRQSEKDMSTDDRNIADALLVSIQKKRLVK